MNHLLLGFWAKSAFRDFSSREESATDVKKKRGNCEALEVCCAVKFSKNECIILAYQSCGTGNAVICARDNGRLW